MVKILHTSDLHLEKQLLNTSYSSEFASSRRAELWETLKRILDYSTINDVDIVVIAGDLFESEYFGLSELYRLYNLFEKYFDIRIVILTGNHDSYIKNSVYKQLQTPENVYLLFSDNLNYIEFHDLKTRVYGIGWMESSYTEVIIDSANLDDNLNNILVLHGNLINKEKEYMYFDKDSLLSNGFDYIALGHIHSYIDLADNMAYSGSPEPLDFGEQGDKGFVLINLTKGKCIKEFIPFSKRKFIANTFTFNSVNDEESLIHYLLDIKNDVDFFRIYLDGIISDELSYKLDYILKSLTDNFYYIEFINNTFVESHKDFMKHDPYLIEFSKYINNLNIDNELKEMALKKGLSMIIGDTSVNTK